MSNSESPVWNNWLVQDWARSTTGLSAVTLNARLDELQAGIKTGRRNINLRYADDTTLVAESKKQLKSLLMRLKEKSEKVGLKLSQEFQNTEIVTSGPIVYACACLLSCFSHVQLFVTLWSVACQAPLSMGFSRQEHWSGLPCPPPGESSQPRDRIHISYVSCFGRRVLYH